MLGLVFTEFVEMVEATHSHAVADAVLEAAGLPHGGAYTAVGYYPPEEFNRLLAALSRHTGEPPDHRGDDPRHARRPEAGRRP